MGMKGWKTDLPYPDSGFGALGVRSCRCTGIQGVL